SDGPGALPRLHIVGDQREQPVQLDSSSPLWPQRTKRPVLTGKGFGKESENLSTRVSVQRPDSAIPRGNTPVHADYSSEAYLFSVGTLSPRILTMLSSAASAFASSGLTGAFLQRGLV